MSSSLRLFGAFMLMACFVAFVNASTNNTVFETKHSTGHPIKAIAGVTKAEQSIGHPIKVVLTDTKAEQSIGHPKTIATVPKAEHSTGHPSTVSQAKHSSGHPSTVSQAKHSSGHSSKTTARVPEPEISTESTTEPTEPTESTRTHSSGHSSSHSSGTIESTKSTTTSGIHPPISETITCYNCSGNTTNPESNCVKINSRTLTEMGCKYCLETQYMKRGIGNIERNCVKHGEDNIGCNKKLDGLKTCYCQDDLCNNELGLPKGEIITLTTNMDDDTDEPDIHVTTARIHNGTVNSTLGPDDIVIVYSDGTSSAFSSITLMLIFLVGIFATGAF